MIQFSLKQLTYFVTAAELGSVSEAAKALYISQPSISAAIAGLEAFYGQPLLVRHHGSGVSTTPLGKELLEQARQLLKQAEEMTLIGNLDRSQIKGVVSIGCYQELAAFVLPSAISEVKSAYPDVTLNLEVGDFPDLSEGLDKGHLDMVISFDMALKDNVVKHKLRAVRPYAMLPQDHPLTEQTSVSLSELLRYPFIISDSSYSAEHYLQLFTTLNLTPNVAFRARSLELTRGLVANGHGVSAAYVHPVSDLVYDGKAIVCRPLNDELSEHRIVLARCQTYGQTRAGEAVWSLLENQVTQTLLDIENATGI